MAGIFDHLNAVATQQKASRRVAGLRPTSEQNTIIQSFLSGASIAVEAAPGSGKTSLGLLTVDAMASKGKRCIFTSYTKSIVENIQERLDQYQLSSYAKASTIHSLGFSQTVMTGLIDRTAIVGDITPYNLSSILKEKDVLLFRELYEKFSSQFVDRADRAVFTEECHLPIKKIIIDSYKKFLVSSNRDPNMDHVDVENHYRLKYNRLLKMVDSPRFSASFRQEYVRILERSIDDMMACKKNVLSTVKNMWGMTMKGSMPVLHDAYLKMYVNKLEDGSSAPPRIDYLIADEFQDANSAMLKFVDVLRKRNIQVLCVGDPNQHIFSFRGDKNGFETLPFDIRGQLTQSFRFNDEIAGLLQDYARNIMGQPEYIIKGNPDVKSVVDDFFTRDERKVQSVVLTRTNMGILQYVADNPDKMDVIHIPKGGEILKTLTDIDHLVKGEKTTGPLAGIKSIDEIDDANEFRFVKQLVSLGHKTIQKMKSAVEKTAERTPERTHIVATTHWAKGQEFSAVYLAKDLDFSIEPKIKKNLPMEEQLKLLKEHVDELENRKRLLFVAMSRAKNALDPSDIKILLPLAMPLFRDGKKFDLVMPQSPKRLNSLEKQTNGMAVRFVLENR